MRPKVDGALHLHELTEHMPLGEFVLFSSIAGTLGSPRRANYAAANSVLDALALARRRSGLAGLSLAFGLWASPTGLAGRGPEDGARLVARLGRSEGLLPLQEKEGLALFDIARGSDRPVVVPARLDSARFQARADEAVPPILRRLVRAGGRKRSDGRATLVTELAHAPQSQWDDILLTFVLDRVASILGQTPGEDLNPESPLLELGLDSLGAISLRNVLGQATGIELPATFAADYPSPAMLASYLRAHVGQPPREERSSKNGGTVGTLTKLLLNAHAHDTLSAAICMCVEASRIRPTFGAVDELTDPPRPVTIVQGAGTAALFGIPSFVHGGVSHEFLRLARELNGERTVATIRLAGFGIAEPLPATWAVAVDTLGRGVLEAAAGKPFVLAGYSSGGALAYSVAEHLEMGGTPPDGVVLLDSYLPSADSHLSQFAGVMSQILDRPGAAALLDDDALVAMGAYLRLFAGLRPRALRVPSLLLRPEHPLGAGGPENGRLSPWWPVATTVEIPGDHFSIVDTHARTAAQAIDAWLAASAAVT